MSYFFERLKVALTSDNIIAFKEILEELDTQLNIHQNEIENLVYESIVCHRVEILKYLLENARNKISDVFIWEKIRFCCEYAVEKGERVTVILPLLISRANTSEEFTNDRYFLVTNNFVNLFFSHKISTLKILVGGTGDVFKHISFGRTLMNVSK